MSQSLTSKYRPQTFADVAGQETIKRILSRASAEDRIAPAYLFSGTRGVGKTTIARILAKAVNCEKGPAQEPCNECIHCRQITQGAAVDVVEIDGASNRGIDDARRLKEDIGYAPMQCRYKVFIIDEAHMLTREAFNALLKTLEEPPGNVAFILATTEPHKFPATIISRCQHYAFKRLTAWEIEDHLANILTREEAAFDTAALKLIARRAAGSVRDSMSLLGQVLALGNARLVVEDVRSILGLAGQEMFFRVMEGIEARDCVALSHVLGEVLDQGLDLGFFLRELTSVWRNLFLLKQSGEAALELLELPEEEATKWLEWAPRFSVAHIHACWQLTLEGQRRVLTALEPALALELLLLNLAFLPDLLSLETLSAPQGQGGPGGGVGSGSRPGAAPQMPPRGGGQGGFGPGQGGTPSGAQGGPAPQGGGRPQGGFGPGHRNFIQPSSQAAPPQAAPQAPPHPAGSGPAGGPVGGPVGKGRPWERSGPGPQGRAQGTASGSSAPAPAPSAPGQSRTSRATTFAGPGPRGGQSVAHPREASPRPTESGSGTGGPQDAPAESSDPPGPAGTSASPRESQSASPGQPMVPEASAGDASGIPPWVSEPPDSFDERPVGDDAGPPDVSDAPSAPGASVPIESVSGESVSGLAVSGRGAAGQDAYGPDTDDPNRARTWEGFLAHVEQAAKADDKTAPILNGVNAQITDASVELVCANGFQKGLLENGDKMARLTGMVKAYFGDVDFTVRTVSNAPQKTYKDIKAELESEDVVQELQKELGAHLLNWGPFSGGPTD